MIEIITKNAFQRFHQLCDESICIKAAVAYWTLPKSILPVSFIKSIGHPEGFLCTDIHSPTSINCLSELRSENSNIYLHLFQLIGRTEVDDSKGIPDNLMHSKVYIFENETDLVKIWIGSHNATLRAMTGINFECSSVITTDKKNLIYKNTLKHLLDIKQSSLIFDLNLISYYKSLQGGLATDGFIEVEDTSGDELQPKEQISIFGSLQEDYQQLKKVGKRLYLAVSNTRKNQEMFYSVKISQTGLINSKNKSDISFSARRYAKRFSPNIPTLEQKQNINSSIYKQSNFFVTLEIESLLPQETNAIEAPPEKTWQEYPKEKYEEITNQNSSDNYKSETVKPIYRVQEPAYIDELITNLSEHIGSASNFENDERSEFSRAFKVLDLNDKKQLKHHAFIRRRILIK